MSKKNKKDRNPSKIPVTELDLIHARAQGRYDGYKRILDVMTFVLRNDFGFTDDQMDFLAKRLATTTDSIAKGRITDKDLVNSMKVEHDLTIVLK